MVAVKADSMNSETRYSNAATPFTENCLRPIRKRKTKMVDTIIRCNDAPLWILEEYFLENHHVRPVNEK